MTDNKIRLPAEWESQSAILIAWPHEQGDFGDQLDNVEETYQLIVNIIASKQKLIILCKNNTYQKHIEGLLQPSGNIHFLHISYNDIWVRDTAPLTILQNNEYYFLNFQFNGWGNKYPFQDDNAINSGLFNSGFFPSIKIKSIDFVLEGGSIDSDGKGTLLTTRQCLLNKNRNPKFSKNQISQILKHKLGAKKILWLDQQALEGDDTDAHIDTLARFCPKNIIAYSSCDNPDDIHYSQLKSMEEQLKSFTDTEEKPFVLLPLPLPGPIYNKSYQRLPANYCNFLITNQAVLLPVYDDPNDDFAYQQISSCFPGHEIIKIACLSLIQQFGSLHCMTMQFPDKIFNPTA